MKFTAFCKHMGILALSLSLLLPGMAVHADSMLSISSESQIRPIEDGSGRYLLKSDGFYCLKEDGSKDAVCAVHYFDHVSIDGTVLNGFYYHDETGHFAAGSPHVVSINNLTCQDPDFTEETATEGIVAEDTVITFNGIYMVNNLGKLSAAPQVRYMNELNIAGVVYNGYYYFNEYGRMITETGSYELHMTSNGKTFDGTYYFGGQNGVLVTEATTTEEGFPVDETGMITGLDNLNMTTLAPQLESMLSGYDGEWSVYVKNLNTNEEILLNDQPLYSASLIKAFVMEATYADMDAVLQNEATYMKSTVDNPSVEQKVEDLLWNMITVSDNESCNELGKLHSDTHDFLIGAQAVDDYIKAQGYTDTAYQSTLHPSASAVQSLGGHNTTSVSDCGELLEKIFYGECVSEEASAEMLELLLNQQNTTKIPSGVPDDVQTANKTGETDDAQHDIAIVWGPKTTYILCVMSEGCNSDTAVYNIRNISKVVYNYLNLSAQEN